MDEYEAVHLPFPVGIYGHLSNTVYVSTIGMLTLVAPENFYFGNYELPFTTYYPSVAIFPYWIEYMYTMTSVCNNGISYEVHQTSRGQTFTVEYTMVVLRDDGSAPTNHFTVSLYKDHPGLVRFVYYHTYDVDHPTIGVQASDESYSQYSFGMAMPDNFYVEIDTSSGDAFTTSGQL
jgi:hypothetical protein